MNGSDRLKTKKYYIFGAHSRASTVAEYLRFLKPKYNLLAFLIDNEEENPKQIDGIPVIKLEKDANKPIDTKLTVYLGIRGEFHGAVSEKLRLLGFEDIIAVTPELDIDLRNRYMSIIFGKQGRVFRKIYDVITKELKDYTMRGSVYLAKSIFDRPLIQTVPMKEYERIIQVGRKLAEADIPEASVRDDIGDNISGRNRQFSELTGMYWLWKHSTDDVIGLEHYRRRFLLPEGWQLAFAEGKADVILPVPLYVAPSLEGNYLFRHDRRPWDAMLRILKEGENGMYEAALRFFRENGCYSPCNMLIARKEVLDDLCSWMFPVLLQVVEEVGILDNAYQNRYGGFLSERMISFFFYYYADRYKIVYADKSFLG